MTNSKYKRVLLKLSGEALIGEKGYGIDKIGQFLEAQGVSSYIIELGGELLAKGKNLKKHCIT